MTPIPGTQTRDLFRRKAELARQMLDQGLTTRQICAQLKCSKHFVYRVRREMEEETAKSA